MMNEICWIILMMWCIGNTPSLKVNKKPELDNYILRITSNGDEWEENRVISTTQYKLVWNGSGLRIKITCAGGIYYAWIFDEDNGV